MTSRTEAQILDSQRRAERGTLGTVATTANGSANQPSQVAALPPVETVATGIVAAAGAIRRQVEPASAEVPLPGRGYRPVTRGAPDAPDAGVAEPQKSQGDLEPEAGLRVAATYKNDAQPVLRSRLVPWPARGAPDYANLGWFHLKRGRATERFDDLGLHFDQQCTNPHPGQIIYNTKPAQRSVSRVPRGHPR
jgi:hypothetical protein